MNKKYISIFFFFIILSASFDDPIPTKYPICIQGWLDLLSTHFQTSSTGQILLTFHSRVNGKETTRSFDTHLAQDFI